jgi:hypothetical protein
MKRPHQSAPKTLLRSDLFEYCNLHFLKTASSCSRLVPTPILLLAPPYQTTVYLTTVLETAISILPCAMSIGLHYVYFACTNLIRNARLLASRALKEMSTIMEARRTYRQMQESKISKTKQETS